MTNAYALEGMNNPDQHGTHDAPEELTASVDRHPANVVEHRAENTGGAVLHLAQTEIAPSNIFTIQDLEPHPVLGQQHRAHERKLFAAINEQLDKQQKPDQEPFTPFIVNDNAANRIQSLLKQKVTYKVSRERGVEALTTTRRKLVDPDEVIGNVLKLISKDEKGDDNGDPTPMVFAQYLEVASKVTKPRSDERAFPDGQLRDTLFDAISMMHEPAVRREINRQVDTYRALSNNGSL